MSVVRDRIAPSGSTETSASVTAVTSGASSRFSQNVRTIVPRGRLECSADSAPYPLNSVGANSDARRGPQKEIERLREEHALLRSELAKLFEEREGKPCEVVVVGEKVDYQRLFVLNT